MEQMINRITTDESNSVSRNSHNTMLADGEFVASKFPFRKFKGSIDDNYSKYLSDCPMIGFTQTFTESETVYDEIDVEDVCRGFNVTFKVRFCKVTFGDNNEFFCRAIVTEQIDISKKLPMNGFGSYSHLDELKTLEKAVIIMARKNDLMICSKICSWPFAKAIVQENHFLPD